MAKLVDAPASGAGDRKVVEVRVLFWAPNTDLMSLPFKTLIIETFAIKLIQVQQYQYPSRSLGDARNYWKINRLRLV